MSEKLLEWILKNIRTNLKEVVLLISCVLVGYFYLESKEQFQKTLDAETADKIFYRNKYDSILRENSKLQRDNTARNEQEINYLRENNDRVNRLLKDN